MDRMGGRKRENNGEAAARSAGVLAEIREVLGAAFRDKLALWEVTSETLEHGSAQVTYANPEKRVSAIVFAGDRRATQFGVEIYLVKLNNAGQVPPPPGADAIASGAPLDRHNLLILAAETMGITCAELDQKMQSDLGSFPLLSDSLRYFGDLAAQCATQFLVNGDTSVFDTLHRNAIYELSRDHMKSALTAADFHRSRGR